MDASCMMFTESGLNYSLIKAHAQRIIRDVYSRIKKLLIK